ncbi:MAG: phage tailspike protein [Aeromonas sp.]
MSDILVTSPYRPFTLPNQFKAVFNGYIYCGTVDAVDPSVSQVQVYLANEDGSRTPVAQPLRTNAGGFLVYNGQPAKFVTDSNHSLLVNDSLGVNIWYSPDMSSVDPEAMFDILTNGYNYDQIRNNPGGSGQFRCYGRSSVADGGDGMFYVDYSDNSTLDDDGYCLVTSSGLRVKRFGFTAIDPAWYGAVSDYDSVTKAGTSSSHAFFKAISLAAAGVTPFWQDGKTFNEICKLVKPRTGNYKFTTSVPIPSGVIVDLNQSLIGGDGFTDLDCEAFVTGYIDTDGVLKSNLALGDEVGRVIGAKLRNWRATNLKKFFHAKNFNEGSACEDGYAYNVQQVFKGRRCFYGAFRWSVSRGTAGGTLLPAFDFDQFVNIMDLDGLVATDRQNLQRISGGANALHVRNQAYEGGGTGYTVNGEVYPALFSCNYFEALTVKGLDMSDPSTKRGVVADNNWFYNMPIGIHGASLLGGRIGCGNYFLDCGINVHVSDNVSTVTVDIPPSRLPDSASLKPVFPVDKYVLGQAVDVRYRVHNFSNITGETLAAQNYAGDRPMDMPYSGKQGYVPGKVAFCDVARIAGSGSSFTVIIDSKISFDNYVMYSFRLRVVDNIADRLISGHGYGDVVVVDHVTGTPLTVTASNVDGYLRLTLGTFDGVSFTCEGVLRHT